MKNIKILFLDDCPNRTKLFKSKYPNAITVETATKCIKILEESESIEELYLDHDLGGMVMANSDREDCGMEVVRWLVDNKRDIKTIIVHSLNPVGAVEMVKKLKDADYNAYKFNFLRLAESLRAK